MLGKSVNSFHQYHSCISTQKQLQSVYVTVFNSYVRYFQMCTKYLSNPPKVPEQQRSNQTLHSLDTDRYTDAASFLYVTGVLPWQHNHVLPVGDAGAAGIAGEGGSCCTNHSTFLSLPYFST